MLLLAYPRTFAIGCATLFLNNLFTIGCYLSIGSLGGLASEILATGVTILLWRLGHPFALR